VSHISHETEYHALSLYAITYIASTIMRHSERSDEEITKFDWGILLNELTVILRNFLRHTIVALYASMHLMGGINRYVILSADDSDRLDMVGMVMSNQYALYGGDANAVFVKVFLDGAHPHA
jgi:hypothetical protein